MFRSFDQLVIEKLREAYASKQNVDGVEGKLFFLRHLLRVTLLLTA